MSFPDNFEDFVWIIGGNGRFSIFAFDFELYELGFLFPIVVQGEPVVQVLGREAPAMVNSFWAEHGDGLDVWKHDGFGGGEGEEILIDDDEVSVDCDLFVEV